MKFMRKRISRFWNKSPKRRPSRQVDNDDAASAVVEFSASADEAMGAKEKASRGLSMILAQVEQDAKRTDANKWIGRVLNQPVECFTRSDEDDAYSITSDPTGLPYQPIISRKPLLIQDEDIGLLDQISIRKPQLHIGNLQEVIFSYSSEKEEEESLFSETSDPILRLQGLSRNNEQSSIPKLLNLSESGGSNASTDEMHDDPGDGTASFSDGDLGILLEI